MSLSLARQDALGKAVAELGSNTCAVQASVSDLARPELSTAILALSKSPKHDVYVSPMLFLSPLLASTASKSNSGSMHLRSANANGFEGFQRVCVRGMVVAETKMWRLDLRLSLCHTC